MCISPGVIRSKHLKCEFQFWFVSSLNMLPCWFVFDVTDVDDDDEDACMCCKDFQLNKVKCVLSKVECSVDVVVIGV